MFCEKRSFVAHMSLCATYIDIINTFDVKQRMHIIVNDSLSQSPINHVVNIPCNKKGISVLERKISQTLLSS